MFPEARSLLNLRRRLQLLLIITASLVIGWYGRNAIGGNIMGLQELQNQPTPSILIVSASHLDWWSESSALLLGALWTGNSSFLTYSRCFIWGQAAWLAIGCGSFLKFTRRLILSPFAMVFSAALTGSIILSNWFTHGKSAGTSPWYAQPLYLCALFAAISSTERLPVLYRRVGIILSLLIFIPTVPLKYVPWYTAMSDGKATVSMLWEMNWPELARRSAIVFGQPAWLLATISICSIVLAVIQAWRLCRTH